VDDIAQVVAFLCEEGSRWVTGSTTCANGGAVFV
jgi:3-oxoacyl-[acyl-carrier protein] reductase